MLHQKTKTFRKNGECGSETFRRLEEKADKWIAEQQDIIVTEIKKVMQEDEDGCTSFVTVNYEKVIR